VSNLSTSSGLFAWPLLEVEMRLRFAGVSVAAGSLGHLLPEAAFEAFATDWQLIVWEHSGFLH